MIKPNGVLDDCHRKTVAVRLGVGHGASAYPNPIKATQPWKVLDRSTLRQLDHSHAPVELSHEGLGPLDVLGVAFAEFLGDWADVCFHDVHSFFSPLDRGCETHLLSLKRCAMTSVKNHGRLGRQGCVHATDGFEMDSNVIL